MKFLTTILLLLLGGAKLFAAPLLLKTTKEIATDASGTIAIFDSSKYRQLRIRIKMVRENEAGCSAGRPGKERLDLGLKYPCSSTTVFGGNPDNLFVMTHIELANDTTFVIDMPPDRLQINGFGKGTYWIYIWGQ